MDTRTGNANLFSSHKRSAVPFLREDGRPLSHSHPYCSCWSSPTSATTTTTNKAFQNSDLASFALKTSRSGSLYRYLEIITSEIETKPPKTEKRKKRRKMHSEEKQRTLPCHYHNSSETPHKRRRTFRSKAPRTNPRRKRSRSLQCAAVELEKGFQHAASTVYPTGGRGTGIQWTVMEIPWTAKQRSSVFCS